MSRTVPYTDIDPIFGTEIVDLIGASFIDLETPKKLAKIQDIIAHFKGVPDYRSKILKILRGRRLEDGLDAVWTYVQLENERTARTQELDPEDFTDDIKKQIVDGYLTEEKIRDIEDSIRERQKDEDLTARKTQSEDSDQVAMQEEHIAARLKTQKKLHKTSEILKDIRDIKKEINVIENGA